MWGGEVRSEDWDCCIGFRGVVDAGEGGGDARAEGEVAGVGCVGAGSAC